MHLSCNPQETLPIYRKEVFEKLGGFRHGHNGEDMEMAFRMQTLHMKIAQVHDAVVYTIPPATIKTLYKQRTRWISSYLNNLIDYKHMIFNIKYKHFAFFTIPLKFNRDYLSSVSIFGLVLLIFLT